MGSFLVGRTPSLPFCSFLKLSCDLSSRYVYKKKIVLLPTKCKIRPFVGRQNDVNIHLSVPISLCYSATNLYTSVVYFNCSCRLVESALEAPCRILEIVSMAVTHINSSYARIFNAFWSPSPTPPPPTHTLFFAYYTRWKCIGGLTQPSHHST